MSKKRPSKRDEIAQLMQDVFGPGGYDEIAQRFSEWDMGSPRGVLTWLRHYQREGKLPAPEALAERRNHERGQAGYRDP